MAGKLYGTAQSAKFPSIELEGVPLTALPDLLHVFAYQVEDLGAGVDIADRAIFKVPAGYNATVLSIEAVPIGSAAGIDDANTCVIVLKNGASAMATKTFDTAVAFPADGGAGVSLGTIANAACASDARWFLSVTNGATANPPMFLLEVTYSLLKN